MVVTLHGDTAGLLGSLPSNQTRTAPPEECAAPSTVLVTVPTCMPIYLRSLLHHLLLHFKLAATHGMGPLSPASQHLPSLRHCLTKSSTQGHLFGVGPHSTTAK